MDIVVLLVTAALSGLIMGILIARVPNKRSKINLPSNSPDLTNDLKTTLETEQILREEIQILQTKLQQAFEDPVTHLSGWQLFEDRLDRSIKESERFQLPLAVLFIDIDDFKVINNGLSYEVGDALLREVAQRLQTCIRQVDTVCRFTKDTYVIMLTQLVKPETAAVVAQRIMQSLLEPFNIKGHELNITVGIGIAIYPNDGDTSAALLRSADHALHLAKQKGHHIYQFYQQRLHAQSQRDLILSNSLSRDTIFNEFILYFSPIMNVQNNKILCMEVLLHWYHPDLGLINPHELFVYIEKQRKLNLISEWLIRTICKQFLEWRAQGCHPEAIAVPVAIKQLENSHFIYRLSQILQEMSFNPAWLVIQIKEKPRDIPFGVLEKSFNMLKYLGVKIMIDNFGTGLFPLCHLKDFPINYIKLDESMTVDIEQNPMTTTVIRSLVLLAQSMNIELIVQGVRSEKQKSILMSLGCFALQGPLLQEPLTEKQVSELFVSHSD